MAKTKISEYSATANSNTDIGGINVDEGCAPSGINDAIRTLMAQLKNFQTGASGDSFNGPVGTTTAAAGAFTTLSASGVATFSAGSASAPALTTSGDTNTGVLFPAADTVGITTGGTERVRVDSSGNVGIGVSPSAWTTSRTAIQMSAGSVYQESGTDIGFAGNAYRASGGWTYQNTGTAAMLARVSSGAFQWYTAPSGTAGNSISFTQAMTLDASGNLGVGTTSPSVRLHAKTGSSGALSDSRYIVTAEGGSEAYLCASATDYAGIRFPNASSASQAYIDYTHGTNHMSFGVNNGERARIDSSGNLLVGTTALNGTWTTPLTLSKNSGTTKWAVGPWVGGENSFIVSTGATSGVYLNGTSATSWSSNSDETLKENLVPISNAAEKVCSLRAVTGNYIEDEAKTSHAFLIAQDVQAVLPEAVATTTRPDGTQVLGLAYTETIPLLVAAIKEQQAIIESLTARITALEA